MNKISYALGLGIGHQLKSMNIEEFSIDDFTQSIRDVMEGSSTAMSAADAQALLNKYFQEKEKENAQKAISQGKAFLEENGKREGVVTTKSGLQYEVLTKGSGKSLNSLTGLHFLDQLFYPRLGNKRNLVIAFNRDLVTGCYIYAFTRSNSL